MLTSYLTLVRQLLQNPSATTSLYPDANLTSFINIARRQVAGQADCIRVDGTLALTAGTRTYPFTSISVAGGPAGVGQVLHSRQASLGVGTGYALLIARPYEYFRTYFLNNPAPQPGPPKVWSQFGQAVAGTIYFDPVPDIPYTVLLDTVCLPIDLADDTTPEAIPSLWTDAVPYFACYMALLSAQRRADADKFMELFETFMARARAAASPDVLANIYPQQQDQTLQNKLGVRPTRPQQGAGG